ncbi:hypothetical protein [Rhizobium grahamii]|uniref:hypothetical protein n=1 Tax=Rhizobium grahamii TaxID=1120045 RepID=UPI001FD5B501|nr:hypothetical protein [Rhizobium grahamii]
MTTAVARTQPSAGHVAPPLPLTSACVAVDGILSPRNGFIAVPKELMKASQPAAVLANAAVPLASPSIKRSSKVAGFGLERTRATRPSPLAKAWLTLSPVT